LTTNQRHDRQRNRLPFSAPNPGATIDQINYTYNIALGTQTINLLPAATTRPTVLETEGSLEAAHSLFRRRRYPPNNGGDYAEISLLSSSASSGTMEVRFSMLRGSTGFYVTPI